MSSWLRGMPMSHPMAKTTDNSHHCSNKAEEPQRQENFMSDKTVETKSENPHDTKSKKWETILVERRERVGLITLNRPKSLNALNRQLAQETLKALQEFDADDRVGAIVIAG